MDEIKFFTYQSFKRYNEKNNKRKIKKKYIWSVNICCKFFSKKF